VTATVVVRPHIVLIVAVAENGVIGAGGAIPWRLKTDQQRLKAITMNKPEVMGRKTFESIGKPLPGRTTLILSRSGFEFPGTRTIQDLSQVQGAAEGRKVFICGGADIYRQALPMCSDLYLTLVKRIVPGDAFFPLFEDQFVFQEEIADTPDFKITHFRNTRLTD